MRGSFEKHPERARVDPEGQGEFEADPPMHLPQDVVPAWRWVVARLPRIALSSSDEIYVELAARNLAGIWKLGELGIVGMFSQEYKRLHDALSKCLEKLGMSPVDRAKLASDGSKKPKNKFGKLKDTA
jgi:hypothetical protein